MKETSERDASPLTQARDDFPVSADGLAEQTFNLSAAAFLRGIESTFKYTRKDDIEKVISLLSDHERRIVSHGGSFSWVLAHHLIAQLSLFPVSYTHLTLPTIALLCRSRWSPYH